MRDFFTSLFMSVGEIHLLSWILTIVLDLLWNIPDIAAIFSVIGLFYSGLMIFVLCFVLVTLVQKVLSGDDWEKAAVKGLAMGVIAGVPFSVVSIIAQGVYKTLELVVGRDEARVFGTLGIKWREFENLAKAKAKSLNFRPPSKDWSNMDYVIDHLVQQGVIDVADKKNWNFVRKVRGYTTHQKTPEDIFQAIKESDRLMAKYRNRLS